MYSMYEWEISDPVFEAWWRLRQAWEAVGRILDVDLDAFHTTLLQIDILVLLKSAKVPLTPSQIAYYTFRAKHTVSETISRMQKAGYLKKVRTGENQRTVKISIEPKGEQFLERSLAAGCLPTRETIKSALSVQEIRQLSQLLKKLRDGALHDIGGRVESPPRTINHSWMFLR
ncbi:MAG: MarR family winged helix-turn-helix transcriptional regulator [Chloroflexi bacterium]|nr:MarR family winged helix-turn-helix transcriptional regulator [Chloroflexota bacterium]